MSRYLSIPESIKKLMGAHPWWKEIAEQMGKHRTLIEGLEEPRKTRALQSWENLTQAIEDEDPVTVYSEMTTIEWILFPEKCFPKTTEAK